MDKPLKPPSGLSALREMVAPIDMLGTPAALLRAARKKKTEHNKLPVMVLPGIGASDSSTAPLRYFLRKHGYHTEGWGIGVNNGGRGLIRELDELSDRWTSDRNRVHRGEGEVPALCDKMHDRVLARAQELDSRIVLIGWSLGGYVAREVARDLPEHVAAVITMGSPVLGGPKYTRAARLYKARRFDFDWVEQEVERRYENPITQPITAIYSKQDGIVAWRSAIDNYSPNVRHVEVNASHIGMGLSAKVWNIVLSELETL